MAITLQLPNPFKVFITGCIIVVGIILFQLIPKCSGEILEPLDGSIKDTIAAQKLRKDSIHEVVIVKDSIRDVHHHHWHIARHDSLIPCDQKLAIADTLIQIDSSLIAELKSELFVADLIISNQDTLIKKDSTRIAVKDKTIKKLKRQRNIAAGVGALGWIFAVFR